jgi:hypothetical protein
VLKIEDTTSLYPQDLIVQIVAYAAFILGMEVEDGGSMFLQNVGLHLPD